MTTILVAGALANKCRNGGEAWVRMSWVGGLRQLGFHVVFIEQIAPETCVDSEGAVAPFESSVNLAYFRDVVSRFGLDGSAALVYGDGDLTDGIAWQDLLSIASDGDLLVNISGHLQLEQLIRRVRRKAYIDIDPGFTQIWHARGLLGDAMARHDFHFTIAENIGQPDCTVPTGGIDWLPVRQPVVIDDWTADVPATLTRFTTVAAWRGAFGPVEHEGRRFGVKAHEFRKVVDVPQRTGLPFEVALSIHPADAKDLQSLREHGWVVVDPLSVAATPDEFRQYVHGSGAEFSVAQGIYVETNSGWFSDRTVRYLASGRPALVQETGFSRNIPTGDGLLSFRTAEEAADGARAIADNYEHHARAARDVAEKHFDAGVVLPQMLEAVGMSAGA